MGPTVGLMGLHFPDCVHTDGKVCGGGCIRDEGGSDPVSRGLRVSLAVESRFV